MTMTLTLTSALTLTLTSIWSMTTYNPQPDVDPDWKSSLSRELSTVSVQVRELVPGCGVSAENNDQLKFELIKIQEARLRDQDIWFYNFGEKAFVFSISMVWPQIVANISFKRCCQSSFLGANPKALNIAPPSLNHVIWSMTMTFNLMLTLTQSPACLVNSVQSQFRSENLCKDGGV